MEIFNNYLMYKILFDNTGKQQLAKLHKRSVQGTPGWHGSCIDVSQSHLPLRKRLQRRRSGSWTGPISAEALSGGDQDLPDLPQLLLTQPSKLSRPHIGSIGRMPAERQVSIEVAPEIQVTSTDKKPIMLHPSSATEKFKEKLSRKRSGSLPETQTHPEDRNTLAPPVRYEAPASLDPKRKESAPTSFSNYQLSIVSTSITPPTPRADQSPEQPFSFVKHCVVEQKIPEISLAVTSNPKTQQSREQYEPHERPVSAMAVLTTDGSNRSISPERFGGASSMLCAGSSPSLLDLYISTSRRPSVAGEDDYSNLVNEMDSVVLDLGYQYAKPVQRCPLSAQASLTDCIVRSTIQARSSSYSPPSTSHEEEEMSTTTISAGGTPPPSRTVSRESSTKAAKSAPSPAPLKKKHSLIESFMSKLRSFKRSPRTARFRSMGGGGRDGAAEDEEAADDEEEYDRKGSYDNGGKSSNRSAYSTPPRRRWRFSRSKEKKQTPPSIYVQNMMEEPAMDSRAVGTSHTLAGTPPRSLSLKRRSTSAPSARVYEERRKSAYDPTPKSAAPAPPPPSQTLQQPSTASPRGHRRSFIDQTTSSFQPDVDQSLIGRKLSAPTGEEARSTPGRHHSKNTSTLLKPGVATLPRIYELLSTMSYSPAMGFITLTINKARHVTRKSEIYVRVSVFEGAKLLDRKVTPGQIGQSEPEFKQAYVFQLGHTRLTAVHISLELFKRDKYDEEKLLGNIDVGPKVGGTGSTQWERMVKNANYPCSMWHQLGGNH